MAVNTSSIFNSLPFQLSQKTFAFAEKNNLKQTLEKIKNISKLFFKSLLFRISILSFFSFSFAICYISCGTIIFLSATLISGIALAFLIKKKFSDLIYELALADGYIRQAIFKTKWPWFNQITKNIYLGALPLKNLNHIKIFKEKNITSILSIIKKKEFLIKTIFTDPINISYWKKNNFDHLHLSTKDRYPLSLENMQKSADFIHKKVLNNKKIYVHCTAGRSRSASAVICYLLKYKKMDLTKAIGFVKAKRDVLYLNSSQRNALKIFQKTLA